MGQAPCLLSMVDVACMQMKSLPKGNCETPSYGPGLVRRHVTIPGER